MGNSPSKKDGGSQSRARKAVNDLQAQVQSGFSILEEQNHPAAQLIDTMCGPYLDEEDEEDLDDDSRGRRRSSRRRSKRSSRKSNHADSYYSDEEESADDRRRPRDEPSITTEDSFVSEEYEGTTMTDGTMSDAAESNRHEYNPHNAQALKMPLASSFAKKCYFTKAGIGTNTQHYEGLTLAGNTVLMLATAMKLKGCPTICDEDLRRVEQTYPNQFSRLPDELLLSSGWRRISKYCHFSHKAIPDGVPFFHSRQRVHPSGGYYFLLASAVGMIDPAEVGPMDRDTLVLLETDYPDSCDNAPQKLVHDPSNWTLVDRFCFFSGGPINTDEDVYYQAELEGSVIFMLAFLSPALTPSELYKLDDDIPMPSSAVHEVESVYDLTHRDFDDLKLYHLGPCRALPQYVLQPDAWTKVLPPHFLDIRDQALRRADSNSDSVGNYYHKPPQAQFTVGSAHARHTVGHPDSDVGVVSESNYRAYNGQMAANVARDQHRAVDPPEENEPPSLKKNEREFIHGRNAYSMDPSPEDEVHRVDEQYGYSPNRQLNKPYPNPAEEAYYGHEEPGRLHGNDESDFFEREAGGSDHFEGQSGIEEEFATEQSNDAPFHPSPTLSQDEASARPPRSPDSLAGTDFSQSSAMKGAQALLRRNRQRRLEKQQQEMQPMEQKVQPTWEETPRSEVSGGTWGSEVSSGGSSWTDGSDVDRSSRRALILQMAKARMKGQAKATPSEVSEADSFDDEKKEGSENIDLTRDLD